ncbi:hypothetical protein D9M70_502670 [compost metagenome]
MPLCRADKTPPSAGVVARDRVTVVDDHVADSIDVDSTPSKRVSTPRKQVFSSSSLFFSRVSMTNNWGVAPIPRPDSVP